MPKDIFTAEELFGTSETEEENVFTAEDLFESEEAIDTDVEQSVQDRTAQPNIVIPEVIGEAPDLTMEDVTMTDEERTEFDLKAEEQRQKGIEGQKLYLREKQIQDKTGLLTITLLYLKAKLSLSIKHPTFIAHINFSGLDM